MYTVKSTDLQENIKQFMNALLTDGYATIIVGAKQIKVKFEPQIPITPKIRAEIMQDLST